MIASCRRVLLGRANPAENLRVQSHILGASLLLPRQVGHRAAELEVFYKSIFNDTTAFHFSASLWPSNLFSRTVQRSLWVPRVAQTNIQIEMGASKQFFHNFGAPDCIVGVNCQEENTSLIVSSESQCHETLPFLVTPVERHMPLFTDPNVAPFKAQPQQCGVVNWTDICVCDENERRVALHIASMFGWHMSVPYKIDDNSVYIVAFNGSGGLENRHKLSGILPHRLLLSRMSPPLKTGIPLVFFSCGTEQLVHDRVAIAEKNGGRVLTPPTSADGTVTIIQDPLGTPFGLYHRTDEWNETKPYMQTTWDLITLPAVEMQK